jgi:hypothetical protein
MFPSTGAVFSSNEPFNGHPPLHELEPPTPIEHLPSFDPSSFIQDLLSDSDPLQPLLNLKSLLTSGIPQTLGPFPLPCIMEAVMVVFCRVCRSDSPNPQENDPLRLVCTQVVSGATCTDSHCHGFLLDTGVLFCLRSNLTYARYEDSTYDQTPHFEVVIATLEALVSFVAHHASEVGASVGIVAILDASQTPGFPDGAATIALEIIERITGPYVPPELCDIIFRLLCFAQTGTDRTTETMLASQSERSPGATACRIVQAFVERSDTRSAIDPRVAGRIADVFKATRAAPELSPLLDCLIPLATQPDAASAIIQEFLTGERIARFSVQFFLNKVIDRPVVCIENHLRCDFQERFFTLVVRLLPDSAINTRFGYLGRSRGNDPDLCFPFAVFVRASLSDVILAIPPAEVRPRALIALAAAYTMPRHPRDVKLARPADQTVHQQLKQNGKSLIELTPALFAILDSLADRGCCGEVLSVLDRCEPESLRTCQRNCGSILALFAKERRPEQTTGWCPDLFEALAEKLGPAESSCVPGQSQRPTDHLSRTATPEVLQILHQFGPAYWAARKHSTDREKILDLVMSRLQDRGGNFSRAYIARHFNLHDPTGRPVIPPGYPRQIVPAGSVRPVPPLDRWVAFAAVFPFAGQPSPILPMVPIPNSVSYPQLPLVPQGFVAMPQVTQAQNAMAYIENQFKAFSDSRTPVCLRPGADLMELCLDLFGGSNMPLSFIESDCFRDFARGGFPLQELPTAAQLRAAIIARAKKIRSEITAQSEGSVFATLLVDGASEARRLWLASVVVTARGFHFWRLQTQANREAKTIAASISVVIKELAAQHLRVIAVVTDGAANECAALNPGNANSVQQQLCSHVLRIPCFSHGTNLAIRDWLHKDLAPKGAFVQLMYNLISELHALPHSNPLRNAPKINNSRWFDFGQAVTYVRKHLDEIRPCVSERTQSFLRGYKFEQLSECFEVIHVFLRWTEDRGAKLCDAFGQVQACHAEIQLKAAHGNEYAVQLADRFLHQMYGTQDLPAMILTYILTEKGREWFMNLPPQGVDSQASFWTQIQPSLGFFSDLFGAPLQLIRETLEEHLALGYTRPGEPPLVFWRRVLTGSRDNDSYRRPGSHMPLAIMAMVLCNLPLSEADVERVFSHMRQLFGDRSRSMAADLIEARLTIKLHKRMRPEEIRAGCQAFAEMTQDVSAQLRAYLRDHENLQHWGNHKMKKKIACQYKKV